MSKLLDPELSTELKHLSVPEHPLLTKANQAKNEVVQDLNSCDFSNSPKVKRINSSQTARTDLNAAATLDESSDLAEDLNFDASFSTRRRMSLSDKYRLWHSIRRSPKSIIDRLIDFIVKLMKSLENWIFGETARKNQNQQKKSASSGPGSQAK